MPFFVGIDWSEKMQEYAVLDDAGKRAAGGRVPLTLAGMDTLVGVLDGYRDPVTGALPVVSMESGAPLVARTLEARGFAVHEINPLKVKRYAQMGSMAGSKSDKIDAKLLANIMRINPDMHPQSPRISPEGWALRDLARAHQDMVWVHLRACNELRSDLKTFWPALLTLWTPKDLLRPEVLAILDAWPSPEAAAAATPARVKKVMKAAGRQRYLDRDAAAWSEALRTPTLTLPPARQAAAAARIRGHVARIRAAGDAERTLRAQTEQAMRAHHLYPLVRDAPGLGLVLGARLIGELGDDPKRFASAGNARAFAGTAPVTKKSMNSEKVIRRHIKNNRANHAAYLWAFVALTKSDGARVAYDRRRGLIDGVRMKDKHAAALRNVGNRLVGCLWHCIATGEAWDEAKVWGHLLRDHPVPPPAVATEALAAADRALAAEAALLADDEAPGDEAPTEVA